MRSVARSSSHSGSNRRGQANQRQPVLAAFFDIDGDQKLPAAIRETRRAARESNSSRFRRRGDGARRDRETPRERSAECASSPAFSRVHRVPARRRLRELVEDALRLRLPVGFGQRQQIGRPALARAEHRGHGAAFFRNTAALRFEHQLGEPRRQRQLAPSPASTPNRSSSALAAANAASGGGSSHSSFAIFIARSCRTSCESSRRRISGTSAAGRR